MATTKDFLQYVTERFKEIEGVTFRPMMREYLMYYRGKLVGGIYDNRILIKPIDAAKKMFSDAAMEIPYEGAKAMILLEEEDSRFVNTLFEKMYAELPEPKKNNQNRGIK